MVRGQELSADSEFNLWLQTVIVKHAVNICRMRLQYSVSKENYGRRTKIPTRPLNVT